MGSQKNHMDRKTSNHQRVYAFIDSQNLNMGVGSDVMHNDRKIYTGWKLDFKKFRRYLKDKFKVEQAFLFIGNLPGQESMYAQLQKYGYILVFKPTTTYKDEDGSVHVKGNVDTDLVLYAASKEIDNYDKAIVVTGDGDFLSLCEYLDEKGKLGKIVVPNKLRYSQLLTKYAKRFDFVSTNKKKLAKQEPTKKTSINLQDAHYKVTRHGDTQNVPNQVPDVNIKKTKLTGVKASPDNDQKFSRKHGKR
ncbi:MAG TPA: NYN domain-containing protein [Candidatus Saccharimonadales bacterium]|nr:NYN domain-containing protein [Candidatus Saccharimonadales bacterium]